MQDEIARPLATPISSKPKPTPSSFLEPEDSKVSVLSDDTIDDFIQADFAVVQFYSWRCSWSQRVFPEYTKASVELKRLDPDIK